MTHEPTYAHPEAPHDETHTCPGCGETVDRNGDLCYECAERFDACDAVEYPELSAIDAAWFNATADALIDRLRARRAS